MSPEFEKLKACLKELFQLNRPELDFGLYRIMSAKSAEVTEFLGEDLLPQVRAAFEEYRSTDRAELEKELERATEQAKQLGVDPESTAKVKDLRARLRDESVDIGALEAGVYDHLYRFFRRYYSDGDFLSKRVYKSGVYAIPYEGEEVKLHWANADQYYTKTSEYLRDYTFRLRPGSKDPMRVHFRLVDAAEEEHGNVKAANDRVFVLTPGGESNHDFVTQQEGEQGVELVLQFEYRPAIMDDWPPDRRKEEEERLKNPKPPKQKDLNALAAERVLAVTEPSFAPWIAELGKPHVTAGGEETDYSRLEAHLRRYTARNQFDYFIHKDLGGFLRRELDFYIKNEVMHLDDIENESVPRVEQYLSKIKVIRGIAGKIIDFLAQLEEFQKKLWLKKKFVVETSWCVRVGCVPAEFHAAIAKNEAQVGEWKELHRIDELEVEQGDLIRPSYSEPLTQEFIAAHPTLMVDSRHFDEDFTSRLLEAIGNLDEQTDAVLFHSENFQALSLMENRYRGGIDCFFGDPPYNTGGDDFIYRDAFRHSSWLTMMEGVFRGAWGLLDCLGILWITLDDTEAERLWLATHEWIGSEASFPRIAWQHSIQGKGYGGSISTHHNSVLCFARSHDARIGLLKREDWHNQAYSNPDEDPRGDWRTGDVRNSLFRPNLRYDLPTPSGGVIPPPENGWRWSWDTMQEKIASGEVCFTDDESRIIRKIYLADQEGRVPESIWFGENVGTSRTANSELKRLFGSVPFGTPKPTALVERCVTLAQGVIFLDPFAGSGTTGHAVINLNREDGGRRKAILMEMADYFDTVLLPRLKKVTFSPEWKDGKPTRLATAEEANRSPRLMKVVRLESYEDVLNNLDPRRTEAQRDLLDEPEARGPEGLREDYLLRYMLDVETRGSASLLDLSSFSDPTAYRLKVKRPGSDETQESAVDLIETFNWLIGLTVEHLSAPEVVAAAFDRDSEGRLQLDGDLEDDPDGQHWFRAVHGVAPDGRRVLVIWRKVSGDLEEENLVLDEWFRSTYPPGHDLDLIYVNGSNNLAGLRGSDETWNVRLIEEAFRRSMFAAGEAR